MKQLIKIRFVVVLFLLSLSYTADAQTIGAKKTITLTFVDYYEADVFRNMILKDPKTGDTYTLADIDDKSELNGILDEMQDTWWKNGASVKKLNGKKYVAVFEYRQTDQLKGYGDLEEQFEPTGRKINKWMINTIKPK